MTNSDRFLKKFRFFSKKNDEFLTKIAEKGEIGKSFGNFVKKETNFVFRFCKSCFEKNKNVFSNFINMAKTILNT